MADDVTLTDHQQQALDALAALETDAGPASIRAVSARSGLTPDAAEAALAGLAGHDLVRELSAEDQPDADGSGRVYAIKSQPAP